MSPKFKTYIFTIFFSILGGVVIWNNYSQATLPLIIFYVALLINTFFSIEFFAKIIPAGRREQEIIDLLMVASYLALILTLGSETWYLFFATVLFLIASLKYVFLLGTVDLKILKKKTIIDMSGTVACIAALAGSLAGYGEVTNWIWAILFVVANIYLLVFRPMYKI